MFRRILGVRNTAGIWNKKQREGEWGVFVHCSSSLGITWHLREILGWAFPLVFFSSSTWSLSEELPLESAYSVSIVFITFSLTSSVLIFHSQTPLTNTNFSSFADIPHSTLLTTYLPTTAVETTPLIIQQQKENPEGLWCIYSIFPFGLSPSSCRFLMVPHTSFPNSAHLHQITLRCKEIRMQCSERVPQERFQPLHVEIPHRACLFFCTSLMKFNYAGILLKLITFIEDYGIWIYPKEFFIQAIYWIFSPLLQIINKM